MFRINRFMMLGVVVMLLGGTLSSLCTFAQNKNEQVVFDNRTVTLKDMGKKDTFKISDPVKGDVIWENSLLSPVRIDTTNISFERPPYRLGNIVQKHIVQALCNGKYLKSMPGGTPTPDGEFYLGLTDIVVCPDGTVAYYNFHKSIFQNEQDGMTRDVDLKLAMDKFVKESCKTIKYNFRDSYLLLHVNISTMKFSVHHGVVQAINSKS